MEAGGLVAGKSTAAVNNTWVVIKDEADQSMTPPACAIREHRGRKDEPKGFGRKDYRDLIIRAHTQLGGPIVPVWDNLRVHLVMPLRESFEANAAWLTVFQLPTFAPDLNPQEGVWSLVKRGIGNPAAADLSQIARAVKRKVT